MPRTPRRVKHDDQPVLRQSRTRLARQEVVAAAAVLFVEHGYAATTVSSISESAAVPSATVYRLFGSKLGILKAWLDVAIAGDDAPVAVADRPPITDLTSDLDPWALIDGFVRVTVKINGRSGAVYRVLVGAAGTDQTAADLLTDIRRQRAKGQRGLTRSLHAASALRPDITERHAADVVYALMSPENYQLLVVDRRWAVQRYAEWLRHTLAEQLLI